MKRCVPAARIIHRWTRGKAEAALSAADDRRIGHDEVLAAPAQRAAAGGHDVVHPLGPFAEGERDEVPVSRLAHPDRDGVLAPRAAATVT